MVQVAAAAAHLDAIPADDELAELSHFEAARLADPDPFLEQPWLELLRARMTAQVGVARLE